MEYSLAVKVNGRFLARDDNSVMDVISSCNDIACEIDYITYVNFPDILVRYGCFEFKCTHKTAPLCVKKS